MPQDPLELISADVPEKVKDPWYQSTGAVAAWMSESAELTGMALEKLVATARFRSVLKKRMMCFDLGLVKVLDIGL